MKLGLSSLTGLSRERRNLAAARPAPSNSVKQIAKRRLVMLITLFVRFGAPFIALSLILIMLASQTIRKQSFMPVVRIDTSSMDLFSGLYSVLGDSFSSSDEDLGQGLSTSAILLMTNLTSILMASVPDYTESTFYSTCSYTANRYRYRDDQHPDAQQVTLVESFGEDSGSYNFTNTTIECYDTTLFDYRSILYDNGFYYILSLADKNPDTDSNYDAYQTSINDKSASLQRVLPTLIFVLLANALTLGISYYYHKKSQRDDSCQTIKILGHAMAIWTLLVFIVDAVATISMTRIFVQIRHMAKSDFQTFGISVGLELAWFVPMWIALSCMLVTALGWVGPVWCSAPDEDGIEDEEDQLLATRETFNTVNTLETTTIDVNPFREHFESFRPNRRDTLNESFEHSGEQHVQGRHSADYESEFAVESVYTVDEDPDPRHTKTRSIL